MADKYTSYNPQMTKSQAVDTINAFVAQSSKNRQDANQNQIARSRDAMEERINRDKLALSEDQMSMDAQIAREKINSDMIQAGISAANSRNNALISANVSRANNASTNNTSRSNASMKNQADMARNAVLDNINANNRSYDRSRDTMLDTRYQDKIFKTEQDKSDILNAQKYFSGTDPLTMDVSEEKTDVYRTGNMIDEFDTDKINALLAKDKNALTLKKVKEIESLKISQDRLNLKNKFDNINSDPTTSFDQKEIARNQAVKDAGYGEDFGDNYAMQGLKGTGRLLAYGGEILKTIAEPVVGLYSKSAESDLHNERIADNKLFNEYYNSDMSSMDRAKEDLKQLQINQNKNKQAEIQNQKNKTKAENDLTKIYESLKTGKKVEQTIVDTRTTPRDIQIVKNQLREDTKNKLKNIENSNGTIGQKQQAQALVLNEQNNLFKTIEEKNDAIAQLQLFKKKAEIENEYKKQNKEWDSKLDYKAKLEFEKFKRGLDAAKDQADLDLVQSKTYKNRND